METKHSYQKLDFEYLRGEVETKYGYQKLDLEYQLDEVETKHGYQKIDLAYLLKGKHKWGGLRIQGVRFNPPT